MWKGAIKLIGSPLFKADLHDERFRFGIEFLRNGLETRLARQNFLEK